MATGQLGLYNVALRAIGERSLDALTDSGEPRRELDAVWSTGNGALRFLLEQGFWNFAIRTQMLDHSASATPAFGLTYAFERPSDMVRLLDISADERFSLPLNEYESEAGYFSPRSRRCICVSSATMAATVPTTAAGPRPSRSGPDTGWPCRSHRG